MKLKLLTLRKSTGLSDWWVIERVTHAGRYARISDADVEGTSHEMREIARAIEERRSVSFKRCAVQFLGNADGDLDQPSPDTPGTAYARFWSPRNSTTAKAVPIAEADELAKEIWIKTASNKKPSA